MPSIERCQPAARVTQPALVAAAYGSAVVGAALGAEGPLQAAAGAAFGGLRSRGGGTAEQALELH